MSELEEFAGLLAAATQKKVEQFDYASLVSGGSWKAELLCSLFETSPTVLWCRVRRWRRQLPLFAAAARAFRSLPARTRGNRRPILKVGMLLWSADRHMLSILFYKTAEAAKKLGLRDAESRPRRCNFQLFKGTALSRSAQRAFDGLDRGSKGFLNAEAKAELPACCRTISKCLMPTQDLRLAVLQIVGGAASPESIC